MVNSDQWPALVGGDLVSGMIFGGEGNKLGFQAHQQCEGLQGKVTPIDKIAKEDIVHLIREASADLK